MAQRTDFIKWFIGIGVASAIILLGPYISLHIVSSAPDPVQQPLKLIKKVSPASKQQGPNRNQRPAPRAAVEPSKHTQPEPPKLANGQKPALQQQPSKLSEIEELLK
ncbi:hypothetical protein OAO01_01810 [Oligoflexia bacterium]|nr:hypothetical protein [Oligoflexia bacterium]